MIFLFNFKKQFAPLVEAGIKRQTIRRNRKDGKRPQRGDTVKAYTGLRTTSTRLLYVAPVCECLSVRLHIDQQAIVIDGHKLDQAQAVSFAYEDGFPSASALFDWFAKQYGQADFEGFCARW